MPSFFAAYYRSGQGVLTPSASDDISGIFCRAQIPLRETLNIGNGPAWLANTSRPDLVHQEIVGLAQAGDSVSRAIRRVNNAGYRLAHEIHVQGAPALEIYRRVDSADSLSAGAK